MVCDALVIIDAITRVTATGIETGWGRGTVGLVTPHPAFFQPGSSAPPNASGPTSGAPASHPVGVLTDTARQYNGEDCDPFEPGVDPPAWTASSMPGRQACAAALAQSAADYPGVYPNLTVGLTFCVVTGQGHVAAVQVIDTAAHYTVHVIVWN